jgi:hypothetical protein
MAKKATLKFDHVQLTLLIRACDHLVDAYSSSGRAGYKSAVTKLQNIREELSTSLSNLIK